MQAVNKKRQRPGTPGSEIDETESEILDEVDPSIIRVFDHLFSIRTAEAIKPYTDMIAELKCIIADKDNRIRDLEAQLSAATTTPKHVVLNPVVPIVHVVSMNWNSEGGTRTYVYMAYLLRIIKIREK